VDELADLIGMEDMDVNINEKGKEEAAGTSRRNHGTRKGIAHVLDASAADATRSCQILGVASLHADARLEPELGELLRMASDMVRDRALMVELLVEVSRSVKRLADQKEKESASKKNSGGGGGTGSRKERRALLKGGLLQMLWTAGLFPSLTDSEFEKLLAAIGSERPAPAVRANCKTLVEALRNKFGAAIREEFTARFAPHGVAFPVKPKKGKVGCQRCCLLFQFLHL
jgi:hypothetical protein